MKFASYPGIAGFIQLAILPDLGGVPVFITCHISVEGDPLGQLMSRPCAKLFALDLARRYPRLNRC